MDLAENTSLEGMNSAMAAVIQFKSHVVTKLLHNSESWIGVTEEHIQRLQCPFPFWTELQSEIKKDGKLVTLLLEQLALRLQN